jgi:hypothetical protein
MGGGSYREEESYQIKQGGNAKYIGDQPAGVSGNSFRGKLKFVRSQH